VEDISKLLPRSPACLSDWVRKAWFDEVDGRRVWLKDKLRFANRKIHLSTDVWTSDEGTNYVAIVAHSWTRTGSLCRSPPKSSDTPVCVLHLKLDSDWLIRNMLSLTLKELKGLEQCWDYASPSTETVIPT
jgi:hypothetical protein